MCLAIEKIYKKLFSNKLKFNSIQIKIIIFFIILADIVSAAKDGRLTRQGDAIIISYPKKSAVELAKQSVTRAIDKGKEILGINNN